jgi:hypothetical protein
MDVEPFILRLQALEARVEQLEKKKKPCPNGSDWLAELKADPLFSHVDFEDVLRKIAIWKLKPKNMNRQITKQFMLNWLSKLDVPIDVGTVKQRPPAPPPKTDPIMRGLWKQTYGSPQEHGYD